MIVQFQQIQLAFQVDGNSSRAVIKCSQSSSLVGSEIYTAEPDIPEFSILEVEFAIDNFRYHKSPGADHNPSELIHAGGRKLNTDT